MSACLSNFAAPADSNSASNEDAQQRINREATTVSGRLCIEATAVSRLGICSSKCHILLGDTRAGSLSDNSSWPQRSDSRVLTANLCSNRARPATLRYASVSGRYQAGTSHHDIHHTTRRLAALSPATTASDPRKSLVPLNYVQLRSGQRSAVRRSYTDDKSVACSRRGRGHHGLMKTPRKANDRLSSLPPVRANTRGLWPAAPRPARHAAERCTPSRSAPILNA